MRSSGLREMFNQIESCMCFCSRLCCVKIFKCTTRTVFPSCTFRVFMKTHSVIFLKSKDTYFLILYFSVAYCSANFSDWHKYKNLLEPCTKQI